MVVVSQLRPVSLLIRVRVSDAFVVYAQRFECPLSWSVCRADVALIAERHAVLRARRRKAPERVDGNLNMG